VDLSYDVSIMCHMVSC